MNEQEARQRCEQLQTEHPDRETHHWVPVPAKNGEWAVAKINLPPGATPSKTETRAEPKPQPDDPRVLPPWLDRPEAASPNQKPPRLRLCTPYSGHKVADVGIPRAASYATSAFLIIRPHLTRP